MDNKSNILLENENFDEGLKFSKKAIISYPQNIKIKCNYAIFLFNCGHKFESLEIYNEFDNEKLLPIDYYINYSNILFEINDYKKALLIINKFLLIKKKDLNGLILRHQIYKIALDYKKAEEDLLLALSEDNLNFLTNKILVEFYIDIKKYEKAIPYCEFMINNQIKKNFFFNQKILCKVYLGNWKGLTSDLITFNKNLYNNTSYINPLFLKYLNDDPSIQKKITTNYWNNRVKKTYLSKIINEISLSRKDSKLKIGYFSGDFKNHAVFQLIQDLFVNHDKSFFEIFAYSSFKKEGASRNKIIKSVDHFFDIDTLSSEKIINLVKSHSLDIAIDLSGYTTHGNYYLFEFDIAKIKINYLGFPGTMEQ